MPPKKKDEENEVVNRINEKLSVIELKIDGNYKDLHETFCEKFKEVETKIDYKYQQLSAELVDKYKELHSKFEGLVYQINEMKGKIIDNLVKSNIDLSEKIKRLEDKVETLEEKSCISDNRVMNIEKQNNSNFQYQRGINIEIHGIPDVVNDKALGKTAISILNKIDVPCSIGHIQRCH